MTNGLRAIEIAVCVSPRPAEAAAQMITGLELRAVELARHLAAGCRARTTAVCVGAPMPSQDVLTECLARGIDRAVRVGDDAVEDGLAVAFCLASALEPLQPDLVICAQRSTNGPHGIVPAALAGRLGMPMVSSVIALDIDWSRREARATQALERGARWNWSADLPLVCAVERDVVAPRYLAVRRLIRAQANGEITVVASPGASILAEIATEFGAQTLESRAPLRIRPKKTKTQLKSLSAADRMKLLRGRPAAATDSNGDRRVVDGPPDEAAREILALLDREGLM